MCMRVMKRYNQNANHRLKYKYHKTTHPQVTLDGFVQDSKFDSEINQQSNIINKIYENQILEE